MGPITIGCLSAISCGISFSIPSQSSRDDRDPVDGPSIRPTPLERLMFSTGQQVVCINDVFPQWVVELYVDLPKKDLTYTVRDVFVGRKKWGGGDGEVGVLLVGLYNPPDPRHKEHQELGFDSNRFAPLLEKELSIEELDAAFAEVEKHIPRTIGVLEPNPPDVIHSTALTISICLLFEVLFPCQITVIDPVVTRRMDVRIVPGEPF